MYAFLETLDFFLCFVPQISFNHEVKFKKDFLKNNRAKKTINYICQQQDLQVYLLLGKIEGSIKLNDLDVTTKDRAFDMIKNLVIDYNKKELENKKENGK